MLFLPAIVGALEMHGLLTPLKNMVHELLGYVPNILAAGIILVIAWFIGKFIADMICQLLRQMGFDRLPAHLGLSPAVQTTGPDDAKRTTPSQIVGRIALAFGLTLVAVAVAVALAFGLGGRDAAGRIARHWADGYLKNRDDNPDDR